MGAKQSAEMAKAKRLIIEQGKTVAEAARLSGISKQAIYMAKWYKDRRDAAKAKA